VFREQSNARFHETIAREHLERGTPGFELHRNYQVPLAAVQQWIQRYQQGGRPALEAAAREVARRDHEPLSTKQLSVLAEQLRARDAQRRCVALMTIGVRRVHALTGAVVAALSDRRAACIVEALLTLADLGAEAELERASHVLAPGYAGWIAVARQRLGKAQ
jgi:transposase